MYIYIHIIYICIYIYIIYTYICIYGLSEIRVQKPVDYLINAKSRSSCAPLEVWLGQCSEKTTEGLREKKHGDIDIKFMGYNIIRSYNIIKYHVYIYVK